MLLRRSLSALLLTALALGTSGFYKSTYKKGPEVMSELKERQIADSEVELIKMVIIDESGNTQVREMISVIEPDKDGNLRYLIRFLSPSDIKGVTLLTVEKPGGGSDQYLYLPALGEPRKITTSQQSNYFMGSDFTFEDLRKEQPKDHQYYRLQDDEIEGEEVYVIMSAPTGVDIKSRRDYDSRLLYIDKDTYNILKIEFYEAGKTAPHKTFIGSDYNSKEIDGPTQRPHRAVMNNHDKKTTSIMTMLKSRINQPLPEDIFSVETMKSWGEKQDEEILALFESPQQ